MYVTVEEYKNLGYSGDITDSLLKKASIQINIMCYGRIEDKGFDNLTEHQKKLVKEATCTHANFYLNYADYLNFPLSSFSVSKTSISFEKFFETSSGIKTSSQTLEYLRGTGLMTRVLR